MPILLLGIFIPPKITCAPFTRLGAKMVATVSKSETAIIRARSLLSAKLSWPNLFLASGEVFGSSWIFIKNSLSRKVQNLDMSTNSKEIKKKATSVSGFTFLHEKTYSCNGNTYTVEEYRHNRTGMEFVKIPGGNFTMGGGKYDKEKPAHSVTLSSFLISKTEVTQGVWQKIMATTPWTGEAYVKEGSNYAATYVSWNDANKFCDRVGLKLPTEAQWEYACRSGSSDKYYWGNEMDSDYAWYDGNAYDIGNKHAHQVAQKKPNAFGLYDMSGNVYEWCDDWYNENYYSNSPVTNPKGPNSGSIRVIRGGCCYHDSGYCQSHFRFNWIPGNHDSIVGFRLSVHYP